MIIRRLTLSPFAGIAHREICFHRNLTVVLGPNEAGKSTLAAALRLLLFTPARCGKHIFRKEVAPFMPLGGGNTIRADLEFTTAEDEEGGYRLSRSWGDGEQSELQLPEGGLLSGDEAVQQRLNQLLGLREGTWRTVLFAGQSAVAEALESLDSGGDPVTDLAAILRRALFETDGISIERLEQSIEEEHAACFRRWDRELQRPENNRGIDNPYSREVGRILQAFYDRENARRVRDAALEFEQELDRMNTSLRRLTGDTERLALFLEENRQTAEDARQRTVKELERQTRLQEEDRLRKVTGAWPAAEQEAKELTRRLAGLKATKAALAEELGAAAAAAAGRLDLEKLKQADQARQALGEAEAVLAGLSVVNGETFQGLVSLKQSLDQLTASLRAGRLTLSFTAKSSLPLTTRRDLDQPEEHQLAADEPLSLEAGGRISLEHPQWYLAVSSGDTDLSELQLRYDRQAAEMAQRLQALGFNDLDAARSAHDAWAAAGGEVVARRRRLELVLDGDSEETLRERCPAAADAGGHRPVELIAREEGRTTAEITAVEGLMTENEGQLSTWQSDHGTLDAVLDLLLEKRAARQSAEADLSGLNPLPEGEESEAFLSRFDKSRSEHRQLSEGLSGQKMELLEFQTRGPRETLEEAEAALRDALTAEQRVLREAEAVDRIKETFRQVRSSMDAETMDPWLRELERVMPGLTAGRFSGIGAGSAARLADGTEVPADRLSMGTRAGVGLAVRLAMARYFLGTGNGFLVLDDPLVDMDPQRQAMAANLIRTFAGERQTVLFTCHPNHAKLLGGDCVALEEAPAGKEDR